MMSVISARKLAKADRLIYSIDPESFITLSKAAKMLVREFDRAKVD